MSNEDRSAGVLAVFSVAAIVAGIWFFDWRVALIVLGCFGLLALAGYFRGGDSE